MLRTLVAAALLTIVTLPAAHGDERLEAAVSAAIDAGSEVRFVKVSGHEFHIKAPIIRRFREDGMLKAKVSGRISHHLSFRPDDDYYYVMTIDQDGSLLEFSENINRGGLTSLFKETMLIRGESIYKPVRLIKQSPESVLDYIGQSIGSKIDGNWEGAARTIAIAVASHIAEDLQPRRRDMRNSNDAAPVAASANQPGGSQGQQDEKPVLRPPPPRPRALSSPTQGSQDPSLRPDPRPGIPHPMPEEDEAAYFGAGPDGTTPSRPGLEAPSNLTAARSGTTVSLGWSDNTTIETAYEVTLTTDPRQSRWVRSAEISNRSNEEASGTGQRRHILRRQPAEGALCYRIRAIRDGWASEWSQPACVR